MHRTLLRVGLALLALPQLATGLWAYLAPRDWYDSFPGAGHAWVAAFGPYNEHLTRDAAGGFFATGVLLAWAALAPATPLVRAALVGGLAFFVPHLLFHLGHTDPLPAGDNAASLVGLALAPLLALVLLLSTWRPTPIQRNSRSPVGPAAAEGGN